VQLNPAPLERARDRRQLLAHVGEIDLVDRDDLRPLRQLGIVERELLVGRVEVAQRGAVGPFTCARVEEMDQEARPLEVPEKPIAEPRPRVRPFDEARDVGDDEAPLIGQPNRSQVGTSVVKG
jgi:hypothetical protein